MTSSWCSQALRRPVSGVPWCRVIRSALRLRCWRGEGPLSAWAARPSSTAKWFAKPPLVASLWTGHAAKVLPRLVRRPIPPNDRATMTQPTMTQSKKVHLTAIIEPGAKVPASCSVGPYCHIGSEVELGENCELMSHVVISGVTRIGSNNRFFPFGPIGCAPQDTTYKREKTRLEIGDHNVIREYVTLNRGTAKGGGITRVGSHTLIMAYSHVGHDCVIGDRVMLVNGATLAGHVTVEEWAVVGALCPVHQFVRIGAHAYVGGGTTITQDVLPFSMTSAARDTHAYGMNKVGLERRGFSAERIRKIHHAYKTLLASKMNTSQALAKLKSEADRGEDIELLIRFIEAAERGVIK